MKLKYPEQYTQAYWAGTIVALLDHWKPDNKVSIAQAMIHFHSLKELIGSTIWATLKTRHGYQPYIHMYEALTYQPRLPKSMIGGPREFIFGYYSIARREQHRRKANRERSQDIQFLQSYLLGNQQSD